LPSDLNEKTVGIVGFGAIGQILAEKCHLAFNMKVLAYDPYVSEWPDWVQPVNDLEEIFKESDFVSLHIPLTEQTKNIVNELSLSLMKPSAFLINTSRGGLVDEAALYSCLSEKKIAGAGLDVFKKEPISQDDLLLTLPNVVVTPHSGALTRECALRVAVCAAQGIADYFQGKTPAHTFNGK
jgi:D-3-phosphoglycerate dehydrogenase